MKICPKCNKTYTDDTLNFCLEDGSVLSNLEQTAAPPPTIMVPAPRESRQTYPAETSGMRDEIRTAPRITPQPKKSSKRWLLVVGILLGVVVLCGGGLIGLIALVPIEDASTESKPEVAEERTDKTTTGGDPSRRLKKEDDLVDWEVVENDFIAAEERDGALVLTSVEDYYYVILSKGFETYDASTMITLRNITGEEATSGYGLVFHSDPKAVLEKDYAFLIRTDNGNYRIVQHTKKKERNLVEWTSSNAIRKGREKNSLEVRVEGNMMEFFINGESVEKLRDYTNYKDGVAGVYTSDEIPIAFSRLELRK
ncbi:MAG: hypothetical protein OEM82_04905 [Acidobacteriota bacterium]|nr:hypothetical protein [Acidobacteriota bacterium]MDH3530362.1 hypothetical protein [Acidobacteriota bacterium]